MTPEYVVIFDGTDRGVMGRLLCALAPVPVSEPLTRTLPPDVKPNRRGEAITLLRRLQADQGCEWFTVRGVIEGTNITYLDMHNALAYLRRRGEIVRERKSPMISRPLGYIQRYRWIGEQ
jgi:hypothetical protein